MGVGVVSSAGSGAIRAGRAFVEVFADTSRLRSGLAGASQIVQQFGAKIQGLGAIGLGAGLTGLASGVAAFGKLRETAKLGDVAQAFGLSSEKASRLFGIMQSGGSDLRDATEGVATFNQRIQDALDGRGEESIKIFKKLGVSADQFTGDSADKFFQLIGVLKGLEDPALRVQLLLRAVGEDTGKNLIPLLSMTNDEIKELGDNFVITTAQMEQARTANRQYTVAAAQIGAVWRDVAIAVVPTVKQLAESVKPLAAGMREFIERNRNAVPVFLAVSAALVGVGVALLAIGKAMSAISAIGSLASFAALATKSLISLGVGAGLLFAKLLVLGPAFFAIAAAIPAIIGLIGSLGISFRGLFDNHLGKSLGILKNTFASVGDTAKEMFGGIATAIRSGQIEDAFRIMSVGIQVIWQKMLLGMKKAMAQFLEDNRTIFVTIAGLQAARTGARIGRVGGGLGTVLGAGAGFAGGGLAADASIDLMVAKLSDVSGNAKRISELEGELRRLVDGVKRKADMPGAVAPVDEMAAMRARHPELFTLAKDIRSGFNVAGLSGQRFGFGNDIQKDQLKAALDIKDGRGMLPVRIGEAVADGLKMK